MKNQPNKTTVKDGLPTAEQIVGKKPGYYPDEVLSSFPIDAILVSMADAIDATEEHTSLHTRPLMERVKELEAQVSEISEINEEDDIAWSRMKEIRADDYDLGTEREEEIFQFAFFEGIRYIQKALKK